jgi:hypothetical protein
MRPLAFQSDKGCDSSVAFCLTPMRWHWEVLQARTKVPPIGQPVSDSPFGSGRRRHRELIDVGEWGRFLVLRDVSMGVAGRARALDKVASERKRVPVSGINVPLASGS